MSFEPRPTGSPIGRDFLLDVAGGYVTGITGVNVFGANGIGTTIATTDTEEIWVGSAAYVYPATALMTDISQTVDQGAIQGWEVEVEGLDGDWNPVTQIVELDGADTSDTVTLDTPLIRCNRASALFDEVTDSPIRIHNVGETTDYCIIDTGYNESHQCVYSVPNGKTAYITHMYANNESIAGAVPSAPAEVRLWTADRVNSYEFRMRQGMFLPLTSDEIPHAFFPYLAVPE
ncbi:MAG: hypothetical protein KAJ19_21685, partial [Gammaproteobacteria bacterium]|nr:hypothetical protein [Gammaproteobacteria bacterium]